MYDVSGPLVQDFRNTLVESEVVQGFRTTCTRFQEHFSWNGSCTRFQDHLCKFSGTLELKEWFYKVLGLKIDNIRAKCTAPSQKVFPPKKKKKYVIHYTYVQFGMVCCVLSEHFSKSSHFVVKLRKTHLEPQQCKPADGDMIQLSGPETLAMHESLAVTTFRTNAPQVSPPF